jgi:hypothetical protein
MARKPKDVMLWEFIRQGYKHLKNMVSRKHK